MVGVLGAGQSSLEVKRSGDLSPGVGGIEVQTFPVRKAEFETAFLRFELTRTPHATPAPWSLIVRERSVC